MVTQDFLDIINLAINTPVPDSDLSDSDSESNRDGRSARDKLPFDVAHALARLGYHEAWSSALTRAIQCETIEDAAFDIHEAAALHKDRANETWSLLATMWTLEGDDQKKYETLAEVLVLAQAAAEHCAAVRFPKDSDDSELSRAEAAEFKSTFEAAKDKLKELHGVLTKDLRDNIINLFWSASWLAANSLKHHLSGKNEDDEEDEDYDYDEDNDDEKKDEQHGDDGSSDDRVEDFTNMLNYFRLCYWEGERWQGVRLDVRSLDSEAIMKELEAIVHVPGLPGEFCHDRAINCVRFVLEDRSAEKDPLGDVVRTAMMKAEALELDVVLEVHPLQQEGLYALAQAAADWTRCRGIAFAPTNFVEASRLVSDVRRGGLTQERCTIIMPLPGGLCVDAEDEWTSAYEKMYECFPAVVVPPLLLDGNTVLEIPPTWKLDEEGGPPNLQMLLDATCNLRWNFDRIDIATSLNLAIPSQVKSSSTLPSDSWYKEYAQRLLSVARDVDKGFFFDAWLTPSEDTGKTGLKTYIEKGWMEFSSDVQVMQPAGGTHTKTLVYLHGFQCDGYSYLKESAEYFYKKFDDEEDYDYDHETLACEPYHGLKVVLPSAPLRKITCYQGSDDLSWYDYLTDHDGEKEDEFDMAHFDEQIRRIHKILDAEVALVGARNVILGGASQGCGIALHAGLTYPADLGALIGTMGQLLSCTRITPEWIARKVPVYNYNGDSDSTFPWDAWTKNTWKRLEDAGGILHTHIEPGVDHGEYEDKWLRSFLKEIMPHKDKPKKKKVTKNKKNKGR